MRPLGLDNRPCNDNMFMFNPSVVLFFLVLVLEVYAIASRDHIYYPMEWCLGKSSLSLGGEVVTGGLEG